MPIDNPELQGTEKDGSKSHEFCTYCYQQGSFINPGMTLNDMTSMIKLQMEKRKIDQHIIDMAIKCLPGLKRWKAAKITA
jgi:radical SAM superfamily enzyme